LTTYAALIVLILAIHVGLVLALGRFLTLLDRDDPKTFAEVATPEEIHLGFSGFYFLGNMKFLLYHIIPKSYEFWELSADTNKFADRLRLATALGIPLQVGIFLYFIFQQV
jgi:hypothetical protein